MTHLLQIGLFGSTFHLRNFYKKDINVQEEEVIYNWMDMSSTMMSTVGKPFWVAKEMHSFMLQALIGVCSKAGSFVIDLSTSIGLHSSFLFPKFQPSYLFHFLFSLPFAL
jgi:hypothetical protein